MRLPSVRNSGLVSWKSAVLAMAVARLFHSQPARADDTQASWTRPISANWTTSSDWSTGTYPQNGSVDYQATINAPKSARYSVTVNTAIAVDSLTISTPNAQLLVQNPGMLTLGSLDVESGTINVTGGTLAGATGGLAVTVASGGYFQTSYGSLSNTNVTPTLTNVNIGPTSQVNITTGSTLNYNGINSGTIAGSNATLNYQGNMTVASLGTVNLTSDSVVNIAGTVALQNTDVFSPGTAALPWNLNGGTITGGTLALTSAQNFSVINGTLSGVTIQGLGLLGTANLSTLNLIGGLDGGGQTLDLTSQNGALDFVDTNAQFSNVTITNVNAAANCNQSIIAGPFPGNSAATLTVASSASVQSVAGTISFQGIENVATLNNYGSLSASGPTATIGTDYLSVFNNYGIVSASSGGSANFAVGDLYNSGLITANQGTLAFNCPLINEAGGSVIAANGSNVTFGGDGFNNYGTFTIDNSTASIYTTLYNAPTGVINVQNGGTLTIGGGFFGGGTLHLAGGTIAGGSLSLQNATVSGSGTFSNSSVTFAGTSDHLAFNIGGASQGTGYDSLSLLSLTIGPTELDVTVTSAFASSITPGEQFVVVETTNGVSGTFSNVADGGTLLTTDGLDSFQVNYGTGIYADEVVLSDFQIVPEPSLAAPLVVVAGLLMARRRHRAFEWGSFLRLGFVGPRARGRSA